MQKRGQITVYFIVGFVLVLCVIILFMARSYIFRSAIEVEYQKYLNIPEKAKPAQEILDGCLYDVTYEAVKRAGLQSGYVFPPIDPLPITPQEPFSNTLILPYGEKVPYWYYETSNGVQIEQIPSEDFIRQQISLFIQDNVKNCVTKLNLLVPYNYSFSSDFKPEVDVLIKDDFVISRVNLPIKLSISDFTFNLDKHFAKIDIPFGKLYKTATEIQKYEDETKFLEERTFDLLVAYDDVPLSGTDMSCVQKFWNKFEVINKLKDYISLNLGAVHLNNENFKEYYTMDLKSDVSTSFLYSTEWPIKADISPSNGPILKSNQITRKFSDSFIVGSFVCIDNYNFIYDIKYPLLVTLMENGYVYRFATQVIIKNNQPRENVAPELDLPEMKYSPCENPTTPITILVFGRNSFGDLTPLDGTNIDFKCLSSRCEMGVTEENEMGDSYLTKEFPFCMNGIIVADKEGYHTTKQILTTDQEKYVTLVLDKLAKTNVNVQLIEKETGSIRSPYESETVIFELENKDKDFKTSFIYPDMQEIDLIPGQYSVKSYIIAGSTWPITLKGGSYEKCIDKQTNLLFGLIQKDKECFTVKIDDIVVEEVIKGGAEFEFTLTDEMLNKNGITFYTMVENMPGTQAKMDQILLQINNNAKNTNFRYPV